LLLAACSDDAAPKSDATVKADVAKSDAGENLNAEGCEHLKGGPFVDVTAASDAAGAPEVRADHKAYGVILPGSGAGQVKYLADAAGDVILFLDADVPLAVEDDKKAVNFAYQYSTKVDLHGISTYGGSPTTEGYVEPGSNYLLLLAGEYQLSRRWAVALDVQWSHNGADRFFGVPGRASDGSLASVGGATANTITLAPGVELNVTGELGIILGLVWTPLAQNALTAFGPSLAIGFGI